MDIVKEEGFFCLAILNSSYKAKDLKAGNFVLKIELRLVGQKSLSFINVHPMGTTSGDNESDLPTIVRDLIF